jgi:hypothetical protein
MKERIEQINKDMIALSEVFINKGASEDEFRSALRLYNELDEELQDLLNKAPWRLRRALAV